MMFAATRYSRFHVGEHWHLDKTLDERITLRGRQPEPGANHHRHNARERRKDAERRTRGYTGLRDALSGGWFANEPQIRALAGIAAERQRQEDLAALDRMTSRDFSAYVNGPPRAPQLQLSRPPMQNIPRRDPSARQATKMMNFGHPGIMSGRSSKRRWLRPRPQYRAMVPRPHVRFHLDDVGAEWEPHVDSRVCIEVIARFGSMGRVVRVYNERDEPVEEISQVRVLRAKSRVYRLGYIDVGGVVHARNMASTTRAMVGTACGRVVRPRGEFQYAARPVTCEHCVPRLEASLFAWAERERRNKPSAESVVSP